ncbi:MAG: tetratricopeptide repeat protein [Candidatus Omnitrophota bacterium]
MIPNRYTVLMLAFIVCITFFAFMPSLYNPFIKWDDASYVTENPAIRDMTYRNIYKLFTKPNVRMYVPLTMLSYAVEYHFFKLNPFIFHTTNLSLHLINTVLVFWLIYLLTGNLTYCFIVSLLFGIHPLHVESVAWISERKDVLFSFFFLIAHYSYCLYLRANKKLFYVFTFCFCLLSLFAKPTAMTLPFVLLATDYLAKRKKLKRIFLEKIPFFILMFIFILIALKAGCIDSEMQRSAIHWFVFLFILPLYSLTFYVVKLFFPVNLSCVHPYVGHTFVMNIPFLVVCAIMLFFAYYIMHRHIFFRFPFAKRIIKNYNKIRLIVFALLYFVVPLLPTLHVPLLFNVIAAERYCYLPSIGIFLIIAIACDWYYKKHRVNNVNQKILFITSSLVIIGIFSITTFQRCKAWGDEFLLWDDCIRQYPRCALAYNNRGEELARKGNVKNALKDFQHALDINPHKATALNNRGYAYFILGEKNKALDDYEKAIAIRPRFTGPYFNRAVYYTDNN